MDRLARPRWSCVGILVVVQSPARGAGRGESPGRRIGLLNRVLAAGRDDDGGFAGLRQLDALDAEGADRRAPSCSTTVVLPRSDRISRMVPRTPMVATGVVIL